MTPAAARRIGHNAIAEDGIQVTLAAQNRWDFDVQLPGAWDALQDWAGDHGYTAKLSQAGRYANALLGRLGDLERLDVLADESSVDVLRCLTPESRLKLAQRLASALAGHRDADERKLAEQLADRISDIGLFLEVESRTAVEIAGLLGKSKVAILAALAPLVEAGLVQRGRMIRCPRCNYRAFEPVGALEETMVCRACRETYVLPVLDAGGAEPPTTFQLDGLMARVMDQDILPVLLALRALRRKLGPPELFFCWPGVEFTGGAGDIETDLLVSTGTEVYVSEVKSTADSLDQEQFDDLLALAQATQSRPVIASLKGNFDATMAATAPSFGGHVFQGADLLA